MAKQHTTACNQCPWRRTSAPGWLGASTPEQFLAQAESETRMPCHCTVDYSRADWEAQVQAKPRCAGHAAYLRNRCKMPQDPSLAEFVRSVDRDPEVFGRPEQFLEHHGGDVSRAMGILLGIDNGDPIHG